MAFLTDRISEAVRAYRRVAQAEDAFDRAKARLDIRVQRLTQKELHTYLTQTGGVVDKRTTNSGRRRPITKENESV